MLIEIKDLYQLGALVRAVRKAGRIRQDDLGDMLELSHVYLRSIERGSPTAHVGGLMRVLSELGIRIQLDVPLSPEAVDRALAALHRDKEAE